MTIAKEQHEIEICTFCKTSKWRKLPSEQHMELYKCVKCGNVADRKLRAEDEKHKIYHETGTEPGDKMNITEEDNKKVEKIE